MVGILLAPSVSALTAAHAAAAPVEPFVAKLGTPSFLGAPGLGAVLASPQGTAGAVEIEVLAFASNDAVDEAAALTDAFRHAVVAVDGIYDNGKSHALEAVALTAGCDDPMAQACGPKLANEIKHDKFVYGTVKKSPPGKLTATLAYYSGGQVKQVVKTYDGGPVAKDGASPELKKIALDALYQLTGKGPKAKVEITVTGPGSSESGDLYEGANKVGHVENGKAQLELGTGSHTLELRMSGFANTTGVVEVSPTGGTLTLAPVRMGDGKKFDFQLYGGIAALGVGVVFLGVGVATTARVLTIKNDDAFQAYSKRWTSSEKNICARAREGQEKGNSGDSSNFDSNRPKLTASVTSLCEEGESKQTTQFVWYGLGAALAVTGTVLLVTRKAPGDSKAAVQVTPIITPGYGGLSLTGAF